MTPLEVLRTYFGYEHFRPLQEDIIQSVLSGKDTLALLPTGGGKSVCFQVPTLVMAHNKGQADKTEARGLCLVITPLIALMKDQVENLRKRDIRAAAIYTGLSAKEQRIILDNCQYGPYHFLYISPERLESEAFRERLTKLPICLIAVDEAHCISQWGYDFRPSYLNIQNIRSIIQCPILALTATAPPAITDDIQDRLCFKEHNVLKSTFSRPNLNYVVRYTEEKDKQLIHILESVKGSCIVYVRNRKRCEELANMSANNSTILKSRGVSYYHAGISNEEREKRQEAWKEGKTGIIICTNAFGMGVDKADVRLVIHYDLPDSIEAYYQEAGRAGRDGKKAYCVLLYSKTDKSTVIKRISDNYPPSEFIANTYNKICDYLQIGLGSGLGYSFNIHTGDFCHVMRMPLIQTNSALHLLSNAGYIHYEEEQESPPRVQINIPRAALYDYSLSPRQEAVLQSFMRTYTGIFTELQYIRDSMEGFNENEQHNILKELAQRHIITYIPRTVSGVITMTKERQADIYLSKGTYEERLKVYSDRLHAILNYAEQHIQCREQVLLSYFGEEDSPACGHCDVCRDKRT